MSPRRYFGNGGGQGRNYIAPSCIYYVGCSSCFRRWWEWVQGSRFGRNEGMKSGGHTEYEWTFIYLLCDDHSNIQFILTRPIKVLRLAARLHVLYIVDMEEGQTHQVLAYVKGVLKRKQKRSIHSLVPCQNINCSHLQERPPAFWRLLLTVSFHCRHSRYSVLTYTSTYGQYSPSLMMWPLLEWFSFFACPKWIVCRAETWQTKRTSWTEMEHV